MRARSLLWLVALVVPLACVEQAPDTPSEADLNAAKPNILKEPPATMKHKVNAELEGKLVYLGCDVDAEALRPGQAFTVTHYWKVNTPVSDDWKMFVHMNGQGGKNPFVNLDHGPVGGKYPVAHWKAGEIIRDIHRITLPATWGSPRAEIYTGIWKGNLRLKVTKGPQDGQNRVLALSLPVSAAPLPPPAPAKRYVAMKVKDGAIKVDGKLEEPAWKEAKSTGLFVNTLKGTPAEQAVEARLLYDSKFLYVAFDVKDTDVWSTFKKRDDKLWQEECVELFIDWSGKGKNYIEIQVSPLGTVFDSFLPEYRKHWKAKTDYDFDSGVIAKVKVDGTIDNRKDADKGWLVEMAVPFDKLKGPAAEGPAVPPKVGDAWRINLFRVDRPGTPPKETGSAWSPPMAPDYHTLARFGELVFGDEKGVAPVKAAAPASAPGPAPGPGKLSGKQIDLSKAMRMAPDGKVMRIHKAPATGQPPAPPAPAPAK
jgi:hypothetical protein